MNLWAHTFLNFKRILEFPAFKEQLLTFENWEQRSDVASKRFAEGDRSLLAAGTVWSKLLAASFGRFTNAHRSNDVLPTPVKRLVWRWFGITYFWSHLRWIVYLELFKSIERFAGINGHHRTVQIKKVCSRKVLHDTHRVQLWIKWILNANYGRTVTYES